MRRTAPRSLLTWAAAFTMAATLAGCEKTSTQPEENVSVWVTTPDGADELKPQVEVHFDDGGSTRTTITIDPSQTYQEMVGFGGALTDSSAAVLYELSPSAREQAMRSLFSPKEGIGVSFLRQPIGSSDFTAESEHYTYDDMPPGQTDYELSHFSITHDETQILPLLREAKRLNPTLVILASPWSPPAWMKSGDSLIGGLLIDEPRIYDAYAQYLARFVQSYTDAGVPIDYLTIQNEPEAEPDTYPGLLVPARQGTAVIERLGPLLQKLSPRTKILAYDHNWIPDAAYTGHSYSQEDLKKGYPFIQLRSEVAPWISGIAYHCYNGDPSAQTTLHDDYPDKDIFVTECSGSHSATDPPAKYFRDTLTWGARFLAVGATRNWARTLTTFNLVLRHDGGPHLGGCETCTGMLDVAPDGTVSENAEYYTIGHLSKFLDKGAVRIGSTSFGTTESNGQIMDVAFRNPDGTTVLVVHNESDGSRSFAVAVGNRSFEYTLAGGALATFRWPQSAVGDVDPPELIDLTDAKATSPQNSADAALTIDADGSTRWSTGAAQTPGQSLTVDLGQTSTFSRVVIDAGDNLGDYPRAWTLAASDDGTSWRDLSDGAGDGQLITADFSTTNARYVRVTQTSSSGSWWSISDLRIYK